MVVPYVSAVFCFPLYLAQRFEKHIFRFEGHAKVVNWRDGVPDVPDWNEFHIGWSNPRVEEDDLEPLEISIQDLELTDRQKLMLQPVETRIKQLVYPASIRARVASQNRKRLRRKSRWASKLSGHLLEIKYYFDSNS